jgi:hypothetical protein
MSLPEWQNNGWLKPHRSSKAEIEALFAIVERDVADARNSKLSSDWKFGIAYNAALKLCTILLAASGYRAEKNLQHYRTIAAVPLVLGPDQSESAIFLETCRVKRNSAEYDYVGVVSVAEAEELLLFVQEFRIVVLNWMKLNHPDFI